MSRIVQKFTITGTSPAAAGNDAVGAVVGGLSHFDELQIEADLIGATGGTLDLYLQQNVGTVASPVWRDWGHFAQLAAGAAAIIVTHAGRNSIPSAALVTTGHLVLAAGVFLACHPGDQLRCWAVAGASTTVGAAVTIRIIAQEIRQ